MWDSAEMTGTEAQQQGPPCRHEGAAGGGAARPPETPDQHASRDTGGASRADPADVVQPAASPVGSPGNPVVYERPVRPSVPGTRLGKRRPPRVVLNQARVGVPAPGDA